MYIGIGYVLVSDIFCQQLADIFCYWIYSANNWKICVNYGVLKKAYSATLRPPIDIYPPIVGRIYPILIY